MVREVPWVLRLGLSLVWSVVLLLGGAQSSAMALTKANTLTVHITNKAEKPVWLAKVTLYGPRVLVAESLRNGDAVFSDIPGGDYHVRIERYGYQTIDLAHIAIAEANNVVVDVVLASATLKQIASVDVRSWARFAPHKTSVDEAPAQLHNSLIDALSSLPGVSLNPAGQVSVDGYSPSQTTVAINDVPVSLPGTPQNLQLFNANVFSDASVTPEAGGGGTVNFQTQSPTLSWQGVVRSVISSDQGEDVALQELGTVGDLGISYTHASNVLSNPLEGQSFLDTSGLFYSHRAADLVTGDALQARYELSQENTVLATAIRLDSTLPMICNEWTGKVPCGYGPTNVEHAGVRSYQLKDIARFGGSVLGATLYHNLGSDFIDQTGYFVDGVNEPSSSQSTSRQSGAMLTSAFRLWDATLPLNLSLRSVTTSSQGGAFGPILPTFISRYTSQAFSTVVPLVARPHFNAHVRIAAESNVADGNRASRLSSDLQVGYTVSNHDTLSFNFSPGNLGAPSPAYAGVSGPNLLHFMCDQNIAVGGGPAEASPGGTQTRSGISWSHSSSRWNWQAAMYHNVQFDSPIQAIVNGASLNPLYFGSDYIQKARGAARRACGAISPALTLGDLYFNVRGVADRAIYDGAQVALSYAPNSDTSISAAYAATFARAYGNDPLIFGTRSTVIAGAQLPNIPMHNANIIVRSLLNRDTVGLLQASYTSANNSYNLPPYLTLDAGALVTMPRGLLSITMTNIGNVHPGPFATGEGAVPLRMEDGSFPTVAQPIMPRTLFVGFRFHLGPPEREVTFSIPSAQFQAPPPGFSIFLHGTTGLPARAPADPFTINRQSVFCGPKDAQAAHLVLELERRYVQSIERALSQGALSAFPPVLDGPLQLNYRRNGSSFVVFVSPSPNTTLVDFSHAVQPFVNCANLSTGAESELETRHLFEFGSATMNGSENSIVPLLPLYAPEVGLYHGPYSMRGESGAQLPAPQNLASGTWPKQPPNEPFSVMEWAGCPVEIRGAAHELLQAIQEYAHDYFDLHQRPKDPEGLLITPHSKGGKQWISIRTEDLASLRMLSFRCMFVKRVTRRYIEKLGLDAEPLPQLNYAPQIGLYQVF